MYVCGLSSLTWELQWKIVGLGLILFWCRLVRCGSTHTDIPVRVHFKLLQRPQSYGYRMWVWPNTHHTNYTLMEKWHGREGDGVAVTFDFFCHADTPAISWFTKLQPYAFSLSLCSIILCPQTHTQKCFIFCSHTQTSDVRF